MFGTIRKHQTWLWIVIIGIMIFGLIQWQNSLGRSGNGARGGGNFGAIDGRPITETEMRHAQIDADLSYFLQTGGEWPEMGTPRSGWNQTLQTYEEVFYARKFEQYNIRSDPDTVAHVAGVVIKNMTKEEGFSPEMFVERVLKPHGITAEDFQRFLDHYLAKQQLQSIIGNSGKLVTPAEIQSLYVERHQERAVDVVFFSTSNHLAGIQEPTAAALQQFYESATNHGEYAQPDQMQLSYVFFNITNFLPQAEKDLGTNLPAEVDAAYNRIGTNAVSLGKTPSEAKAKIREIFIRNNAISNAYEKALTFQTEVMAKEPVAPANLNIAAKAKDLQVKVTQPFDKEYGPSDIHLSSSFPAASLFNLSADEPFPDRPVRGEDGVYVVAFDKLIPSHISSLDEIHSRVVADYKEAMARRFAQVTGSTFAQTVTNGLAQGKSFAAISADSKVKPMELPPFSISSETLPDVEDHVDLNTFKQITFDTPVGKASDFIPTRTGGFVLYVRQQLPIDPAKMQAELPEFGQAVRQQRVNEAFQSWFGKEANAALGKIPEVIAAERQNRS